MSNYIQFKVRRPGKIDGKEYKAGEVFPYDPANRQHFMFYEQKRIDAFKVREVPAKKRTVRGKSN